MGSGSKRSKLARRDRPFFLGSVNLV